jgi:hypothetical protein
LTNFCLFKGHLRMLIVAAIKGIRDVAQIWSKGSYANRKDTLPIDAMSCLWFRSWASVWVHMNVCCKIAWG